MKHKKTDLVNKQVNRRTLLKSVALSGAALSVLPSSWTKPVVNSVLLPVHAATTAACPALVFGAATSTAGSGTICDVSFQFLSADPAVPLNVISISNTPPAGTDTVTYAGGTSGSVTATSGLAVNWVGQAAGAPIACDAPVPLADITFTVTYNCESDATEQTVTFSLLEIAASI